MCQARSLFLQKKKLEQKVDKRNPICRMLSQEPAPHLFHICFGHSVGLKKLGNAKKILDNSRRCTERMPKNRLEMSCWSILVTTLHPGKTIVISDTYQTIRSLYQHRNQSGCRPSTLKGWWIDTLYQWKTPAKLEKPLFKHEPPRTKHTYPPPKKSTHGHATEAVPHWCSNIPGRFGLAKLRRRNSCWKRGCERHLKKWWENV